VIGHPVFIIAELAQLVEHWFCTPEAGGSSPPLSTTSRSSSGLGLRPFTAATGVRVPYGIPFLGESMTTRDHLVVAFCALGIWVGLKMVLTPDFILSMLGYIAIYNIYNIFTRYAYWRKYN
jgi:hypothetical protein